MKSLTKHLILIITICIIYSVFLSGCAGYAPELITSPPSGTIRSYWFVSGQTPEEYYRELKKKEKGTPVLKEVGWLGSVSGDILYEALEFIYILSGPDKGWQYPYDSVKMRKYYEENDKNRIIKRQNEETMRKWHEWARKKGIIE